MRSCYLSCLAAVAAQRAEFGETPARGYRSPHIDEPLYFQMQPIDMTQSLGTYSLIPHDLNNDGHTDLVSVAYSGTTAGDAPGEVWWYEWKGVNGDGTVNWAKHLIAKKLHVVHCSFMDVDGDGFDDVLFNSDFEVPPEDEPPQGEFWWAHNPGANSNKHSWDLHLIGRVVGNHRTAVVDFEGSGQPVALAIPLFSPGDEPFYGPAHITLFERPDGDMSALTGAWNSKTLTHDQKRFIDTHDVRVVPDTTGQGQALLLGSHGGILKLKAARGSDGWRVSSLEALHDAPVDDPKDEGARDVGFKPATQDCAPNPHGFQGVTALSGNVEHPGADLLAAIDYTSSTSILNGQPWHGDTVSVYTRQGGLLDGKLERQVLERRFSGGHAAEVADLDGDGCEDVVAGFREYPTAMMLYLCEKSENGEKRFRKQIVSERGTNAIVIDDFNGDGRLDLATCGFGGMNAGGVGGDPYVLLWINRGKNPWATEQRLIV